MIVIVNNSIHDGTVFYCTSKILKNLAAEDGYDSDRKINDGQKDCLSKEKHLNMRLRHLGITVKATA